MNQEMKNKVIETTLRIFNENKHPIETFLPVSNCLNQSLEKYGIRYQTGRSEYCEILHETYKFIN